MNEHRLLAAYSDQGDGSHSTGSGSAEPRPDAAEIKKRSVVIAGHRTSISLENAFWEALRELAGARSISVNQLVTEIDRGRRGNLSSAIRTYVLLAKTSR
ncbi:ribbon-helix-helix domain-containing protein [Marivibrio halodurans]|uniref:Ribbon-helix-helix domain-containing protein n=1 Tax=Marivibrio halodurans TaxID=2039722 RepID=A0A8J7RZE8_9PROT|nr:ribbon-helix-helix domain-containing protein [Marivibrio halodurans]